MDPASDKAPSVNEVWPKLIDGRRRTVCAALIQYRGPDTNEYFQKAVRAAYSMQLRLEAEPRSPTTMKRKLGDGEAADAQSAAKKAKVSEAPAPLPATGIDLASPNFPFGWPTFRQTPVKFGQPTLTATTSNTTPTTWSSCPATSSSPSDNTQDSSASLFTFSTRGALAFSSSEPNRGGLFSSSSSVSSRGDSSRGRGTSSFTGSNRGLFGPPSTLSGRGGHSSSSTVPKQGLFSSLFGSAKANTPANQEPQCDEQFTFADRRSSQPPLPPQGSQYRTSEQIPSSSENSPQATNGTPPVSTIYKPPFSGVDMSSLKIPANSNVSVTLNVFQGPSSLRQVTDSGAPRKLKCIQCGKFYMEAQNTALECRRHTGRCVGTNDPKLYFQDLPTGAHQVWDCCRRTAQGQGCYPCNHYAG